MELLDTRQLRAFQELARYQSFTAASRALHLTQSAVSHSIKALESTLDMALFERQGRVVRLTSAGTKFLPHALEVLNRMRSAVDAVEAIRHPGYGRLSIGSTITMSHAVLPAVLREFRGSFPNYEITISTDDTRELLNLLGNGTIDLAIGMELSGTSTYHFRHFFTDRIAMAMAPVHPLAKSDSISAGDLVDQDFIFYSRESETYQILTRGFAESKSRLRGHLQVGSMAAIKEMARLGMGVGLLAPWIAREELASGTLITKPLPWKHADRRWGLYSAQSSPSSMAETVLFGIIQDVAKVLDGFEVDVCGSVA